MSKTVAEARQDVRDKMECLSDVLGRGPCECDIELDALIIAVRNEEILRKYEQMSRLIP